MVLPLAVAGLLALGGLEAGRGQIEGRRDRIKGQRRVDAFNRGVDADPMRRGGAPDTKFNESGAIFYGGGDLSAQAFLQERYDQDLQTQQENAAMARTQVSSGPAYMNARLNQRKYDDSLALAAEHARERDLAYDTAVAALPEHQWDRMSNIYTPSYQRDQFVADNAQNILNSSAPARMPPVSQEQIDLRDPGRTTAIPPEQLDTVIGLENQIVGTRDMIRYLDDTTAASRLTPGEQEQRSMKIATYMSDALNYQRQRTDAGAMSEGDLELFNRLIGDPSEWTSFTGAEKGKIKSTLATMEQDYAKANASFGLNPVAANTELSPTTDASGQVLKPATQEAIDAARERSQTRQPYNRPIAGPMSR